MFNHLSDLLVPRPGVEPGWVAPLVFETSASTNSAIWATCFLKLRCKDTAFSGTCNSFPKKRRKKQENKPSGVGRKEIRRTLAETFNTYIVWQLTKITFA